MAKVPPTSTEMRAYKIGARARKFVVEGCLIEGYDYLYACLADAKENEPTLYPLLQAELVKFEKRLAEMDDDSL